MNREQAADVLTLICAPYGADAVATPELAETWYFSALERCDYQLGLEIARSLIRTEEFRPTPARFNQAQRATQHHRTELENTRKALGQPTPTKIDVHETVAALKATLAANASKDPFARRTKR